MIGPHEGKELELMLAGRKKLAAFHDVVPPDGAIPEEIIPEKAFAPYVLQGKILRFSQDIEHKKSGDVVRHVCFVLSSHVWRAKCFLWIKRRTYSGRMKHSPLIDDFIGRLLGYSAEDIRTFLSQR